MSFYLLAIYVGYFVNFILPHSRAAVLLLAFPSMLISLLALREIGGTDLSSYEGFWNAGINGDSSQYIWFDYGQHALNSILRIFSGDFIIYKASVIFTFFLSVYALSNYCQVRSAVPFFLIFSVFFVPYFLNASGQGMVMALFIASLLVKWRSVIHALLPFFHKSAIFLFMINAAYFPRLVRVFIYFSPLIFLLFFGATYNLQEFSYDHADYLDYTYKVVILIFVLVCYFISAKIQRNCKHSLELVFVGFIYFLVLDQLGFGAAATRVYFAFRVFEILFFCKVMSLLNGKFNEFIVKLSVAILYFPSVYVSLTDENNFIGF